MPTTIDRTVIVAHNANVMFLLVDNIEAYPDFLPWCSKATVERKENEVQACLEIDYYGLKTSFSTRNIHTPYTKIEMELLTGPLSKLSGYWQFFKIEEGRCRIEFHLDYHFSNFLFKKVFSKLFFFIFDRFIDHFVKHAHSLAQETYIEIEIVEAENANTPSQRLFLSPDSTVEQALYKLNINSNAVVSIYGRPANLQSILKHRDRIEINQALLQDPRLARHQKVSDSYHDKKTQR